MGRAKDRPGRARDPRCDGPWPRSLCLGSVRIGLVESVRNPEVVAVQVLSSVVAERIPDLASVASALFLRPALLHGSERMPYVLSTWSSTASLSSLGITDGRLSRHASGWFCYMQKESECSESLCERLASPFVKGC
jgi:hypothetical protein